MVAHSKRRKGSDSGFRFEKRRGVYHLQYNDYEADVSWHGRPVLPHHTHALHHQAIQPGAALGSWTEVANCATVYLH